jgi:GNAT superfamily N-acetyltransferase
MTSIKKVNESDKANVISLAQRSGLFNDEGIALIRERLEHYFQGNDDLWFASEEETFSGALYCAPEVMTDGTWNVLMLIVSQDTRGQGHGRALMSHVETALKELGARLMIVETSSVDGFERARAFYPRCGYAEEARVKNFLHHWR